MFKYLIYTKSSLKRDKWDVVILGGARDFHAMDWYRAVRRIASDKHIVFLTDSFQAEGFKDLSSSNDSIEKLFINFVGWT